MSEQELKGEAASLPNEVVVTLQEGVHKGYKQLWAPYTHGGKLYKLVLDPYLSRRTSYAEKGETWVLYPDHSPNGHIVFCRAWQMVRDANGDHPIIGKTRRYVEGHGSVSVTKSGSGRGWYSGTNWRVTGELASITIEGHNLVVKLVNCTERREGFLVGHCRPDYVLVSRIEFARIAESRTYTPILECTDEIGHCYRLDFEHPK